MLAKLDKVDLQILKDLQDDGRLTNVDLARRAGISAPPCLRRVKGLEDLDVIKGYHADLNAEALGFNLVIFAEISLESQSDTDLRAFEAVVNLWPMVRECHLVAGEADFLLKIVAKDWDGYQRFLSTQLTTAAKVNNVKTMTVLRSAKKLNGLPLEEYAAE